MNKLQLQTILIAVMAVCATVLMYNGIEGGGWLLAFAFIIALG